MRTGRWRVRNYSMMILALGTILEEIEPEALEQEGCSAVFLADSDDAEKVMELAGMNFDGEIYLRSIEFCKIEAQQECLAGTLSVPRLTDVTGSRFRMQILINQKHIVIVDDDQFAERLVNRIRQNRVLQGQTRERFLYNFMTQLMNRDLQNLGYYERRIMRMEEEVMEGKLDDFQTRITPLRKELLILREYYDELRDLGKELEENENHFFAKKNLKYFGTIADRADRLMGRAMYLLDYAGQVRMAYQEQVAQQQNRNMQFLTVISTIFFPLTLITGWYGMNFENMPELQSGYPGVIVLSLMVVGIIIWIFKKKKIM